jgi:membrane protein YqaA with SNARE-associated domain
MAGAEAWYRRYGRWTLLLSWVPVIGDPLTIVAGIMRESLAAFILLVALAKTARYLAVGGLSLGWI